jgi:hypothetical protein
VDGVYVQACVKDSHMNAATNVTRLSGGKCISTKSDRRPRIADPTKHGKEPSRYLKTGYLLTFCANIVLSCRILLHGVRETYTQRI